MTTKMYTKKQHEFDEDFCHMGCGMLERKKQFEAEIAKDPETRERYRGAHIFTDMPMTVQEICATLRSAPHEGEYLYLRLRGIDIERTSASHDLFLGHDAV